MIKDKEKDREAKERFKEAKEQHLARRSDKSRFKNRLHSRLPAAPFPGEPEGGEG